MEGKPLVAVTLLYAAGILFARLFPSALALSTGCLLAIALCFAFTRYSRTVLVSLLIFLAGSWTYSIRTSLFNSNDLRALCTEAPVIVELRGTLMEGPLVRDYKSGDDVNYTSSLRFKVAALKVNRGNWKPAQGTIITSTRGVLPELARTGWQAAVSGVLAPPAGAIAPGMFNYREYLRNLGIHYQLRVDYTNDWQFSERQPSRAIQLVNDFQLWSKRTLARGVPADETLELIWAITLGEKSGLDAEVSEAFVRTGTMHIFAISGLHVACIAALLTCTTRLFLSRRWCGLVVIPLLWFYTLATGWQPSAVRSALMSSIFLIGYALKRPSDLLNSTAAAGVIILVLEPQQLFQASFQLSFAVVTSMALLIPAFENLRRTLLATDPFLPSDLRPRWQQLLDIPIRFITLNFVISLASWLGSLPIIAWYFNMVTPVSLLANLIAVPLSSISLTFSLMSLVLPWFAPFFNQLSWWFMWMTVALTRWFAEFGPGWYYLPKPGAALFFLYYLILFGIVLRLFWKEPIRNFYRAITVMVALVWFGITLSRSDEVTLTLLPARGTPLFADFPGRREDLLIDVSNARDSEYVLKRFLRAQGIGRVANVLVTHGDINHSGGYDLIWKEFTPRFIFTSPARARSPTYREMIGRLQESGETWRRISAGDKLDRWTVLHPPENHSFPRADDNAVVLKTLVKGWRILLLSDLGREGQRALLDSSTDLSADILIAGVPESYDSLSPELLERIRPKLLIIGDHSTVGKPVPIKLPNPGKIIRVSESGGVTLHFQKSRLNVITREGKRDIKLGESF